MERQYSTGNSLLPSLAQPPQPPAVSGQICAAAVAWIGADATTAHDLPSPCGHCLLGPAVRRGFLDLRRCSSWTEEQGGRRRGCQRERERVPRAEGGRRRQVWVPNSVLYASKYSVAPLEWAERPAQPRPRLDAW